MALDLVYIIELIGDRFCKLHLMILDMTLLVLTFTFDHYISAMIRKTTNPENPCCFPNQVY